MENIHKQSLIAFAVFTTALTGCTNIDFREPITSYNQGMSTSGAILSTYYSGLNDAARTTYLLQAKYTEPPQEVFEQVGSQRTGLVSVFPPEAIKARLDAVSLINQYGSKLAQLAGTNSPERINKGVVNIGTAYTGLANNFSDAAKLGNNDTSVKYIQPVSSIVGVLLAKYEDDNRDRLLADAVKAGHGPVDTILLLLEADIPIMYSLAKSNASAQLSAATTYYNKNRLNISFPERSARLDEISSLAKTYQILTITQPTDVVIAMREANAALLTYAENPKDKNRIVTLTSELDTFNSRIAPIAQALNQLRSN
ncbi:MAG TPA: hypothetical protein VGC62_20335 [Pseudomonas sp.]|uniref:hypothetical protein n=1 Tax=Pseudomonas sp. TaxID=306 RepID=UPI002ED91D20